MVVRRFLGNVLKIRTLFVGMITLHLAIVLSCGQQSGPVLQSAKASLERSEDDVSISNQGSVLRSNSEEGTPDSDPGASPIRVSVFSRKIEPLNLQKGGTAKIALPFSDDTRLLGQMRSIVFVSSSPALKQSNIQGKTLSVIVSEDASEGRHDGRVVVRFDNGTEFSHPLSISVLP